MLAVKLVDGMGDKCNGYWEPFVGGANMIDKINCTNKYGSDIHPYLIALLSHVQQTTDDLPETITEDEYKAVRLHKDKYPDWYVGLVGFCTFGAKWFGGYPRYKETDVTAQRIRNIKKQATNLKKIKFSCRSFQECNPNIKNFVIYCDPPYRDTTKYATGDFPYDEFYDWCRQTARNNTVLISEYWMPEDWFECIWSGRLKCTLDKNSRTDKVEKLFLCKG